MQGLLAEARSARMVLEGWDDPTREQAYQELEDPHQRKGESERECERESETPFWLLVQKAPQGELAGDEWQVNGRCAFPMVTPKDGKSLCFTFGR